MSVLLDIIVRQHRQDRYLVPLEHTINMDINRRLLTALLAPKVTTVQVLPKPLFQLVHTYALLVSTALQESLSVLSQSVAELQLQSSVLLDITVPRDHTRQLLALLVRASTKMKRVSPPVRLVLPAISALRLRLLDAPLKKKLPVTTVLEATANQTESCVLLVHTIIKMRLAQVLIAGPVLLASTAVRSQSTTLAFLVQS